MLEPYECMAPRPDSRRANAVLEGRRIDVQVTQDVVREGSYIVVQVQGDGAGHGPQQAEYITDYLEFDVAIRAGFEIARELMRGR